MAPLRVPFPWPTNNTYGATVAPSHNGAIMAPIMSATMGAKDGTPNGTLRHPLAAQMAP